MFMQKEFVKDILNKEIKIRFRDHNDVRGIVTAISEDGSGLKIKSRHATFLIPCLNNIISIRIDDDQSASEGLDSIETIDEESFDFTGRGTDFGLAPAMR